MHTHTVTITQHRRTQTLVLRQPSQRGTGQFRSVYKGLFVSRLSAKHTQTHLMTALCPHFKMHSHINTERDQLLCTLIMSLLGSGYLGLQTRAKQMSTGLIVLTAVTHRWMCVRRLSLSLFYTLYFVFQGNESIVSITDFHSGDSVV